MNKDIAAELKALQSRLAVADIDVVALDKQIRVMQKEYDKKRKLMHELKGYIEDLTRKPERIARAFSFQSPA